MLLYFSLDIICYLLGNRECLMQYYMMYQASGCIIWLCKKQYSWQLSLETHKICVYRGLILNRHLKRKEIGFFLVTREWKSIDFNLEPFILQLYVIKPLQLINWLPRRYCQIGNFCCSFSYWNDFEINPLTPKIWLLILPSTCNCHTFPYKSVTRIWC